ncbi:MAG: Holliday junction resolvase RuvX [Alphaproteobacteria bacterium]|nr:Holliday junction resolvase RuvX [Alphaproteobacteria bacterium]
MSVFEIPVDFKKQLKPMTQLVGIDYGIKRIGVAVSDLMWMSATPLGIVHSMKELEILLSDRQISGFIVGLPKQMNGLEGSQAKLTREWAEILSQKTQKPVLFWDERFSSSVASYVLTQEADLSRKRQKEVLDKVAAAYILQGALDLLSAL